MILERNGLYDVRVTKISGNLTDNFNPQTKTVSLSESVFDSHSVAAIGVAAHEVGHALQYKNDYLPIKLRSIIIPIAKFSSTMLWPLVMLGLILNFAAMPGSIVGDIFLWSGIIVFGAAALLDFITLPCEFNASKRALQILEQAEILTPTETQGAKKVLSAAALTYVAALLNSILNLLRFVLVVLMHSRRD
jgi:Zn-dependent membrane protease YugP